MRDYLDRHPEGEFQNILYRIGNIDVNPDLPTELQKAIRNVLHDYQDVFHKSNGLPPPMKASPMKIILKDDFKRRRVSMARWKPNQKAFLVLWSTNGLASGRLEPSNGTWSSLLQLVKKKSKNDDPKDWGVRVVGNYILVNSETVRETTASVRVDDNVRKHNENSLFIISDMASGYEQCEIDESCRHIVALLTPIGILQPRRVTFGMINAGTCLQKSLLPMIESLPQEVLEVLGWQVDDFIIAPCHTELVPFLKLFLSACRKWRVSLSIPKTKIGYPWAKAVGHCLSQGRFWVHEDNLAPLRRCVGFFKNLTELRSFLGSLIFCRDHIRNFATLCKPLNELTRKGQFNAKLFSEPEQPPLARSRQREAFLEVKSAALEQYPLYCPNYDWPFHLDTDASEHGIGWCLYQVDPKWSRPDEEWHLVPSSKKRVLRLGSKAFSAFMSKMPVYYKEAWGIVMGLHSNRHFFVFSRFEVVVHSDHQPLRWMKLSPKGVVSSWLLVFLGDINFRVVYLAGVSNVIADPMSRPPLVSPNLLTFTGLDEATRRLLEIVPGVVSGRVWLYAYRGVQEIARILRDHRSSSAPPIVIASPKSAPKQGVAISIPRPSLAPVVAAELFLSDRSFAVLVPTDLLSFIPSVRSDAKEMLANAVDSARKIVFLNTGFLWVLRGFDGKHEVFPLEEEPVTTSPVDTWVEEQLLEKEAFSSKYGADVATRRSGLLVLAQEGKPTRVLVPTSQREPLTISVHTSLNHPGPRRTFNRLAERYAWPGMFSDVVSFLKACVACSLVHRKVIAAHGLYNPFSVKIPFRCYAMDWVVMPKAEDGSTQLFVCVDLASRRPILEPQPDRSARSCCTAILRRVVYRRGAISAMWSDSDQSFLSRLQSLLFKAMGTSHTVTNRYPKGNSMVERLMPFIGEFFRMLPVSRRRLWPQEVPRLEFAASSVVNETTGVSPFKFENGVDPLLPFDAATVEIPDDPTDLLSGKASAGAFAKIGKHIAAFRELAVSRMHAVIHDRARRINSVGRALSPLALGDPVVVYIPSAGEEGWRPKHCLQWRSAFITAKESTNWYQAQEQGSSRTFRRHRSMLAADFSRDRPVFHDEADLKSLVQEMPKIVFPPAGSFDSASDDDSASEASDEAAPSDAPRKAFHSRYTTGSARVGDMLLVRDDDVSTLVFPVRVTALSEEGVVVHYWGTTDPSPTAAFRPCWIERGKTAIGQHARSKRVHSPKWSGVLPDDPDLILAKVDMSPGEQIPEDARGYLQSIGFDHATL